MALFWRKDKKETGTAQQSENVPGKSVAGARIKVLGSGCAKCNQLEQATKSALQELGMDTAVEHVKDYVEIASYGVMSTPALVMDGKVLSYGKVLSKDEVTKLIREAQA
jgi:small redox-active disulfide protein 2